MKKVLVLGAGLVARPLVRYLLGHEDIHLKIASRTLSKAEKLIDGHARGEAQQLNAEDEQALRQVIHAADIVISLLPWTQHLRVANLCLKENKNLVTTSYVKPEMLALDTEAKKRGLLFLNEIGVDPGIDHMAAKQIIDQVKKDGGEIESFYSYCGGLPALQDNTNPFGYKFSWSPVGVMLAAMNNGRYQKDGKIVDVSGQELFEHYWLLDVPGSATFEAYVNRDALPYKDLYGIPDVKSIYRGTLRNIGHCESWNYFKKLGLFNRDAKFDFDQLTPADVMAELVKGSTDNLEKDLADFLGIPSYSVTIKKMKWLGLLSGDKLALGNASAFDLLAYLMQERLVYAEGEIDLLVQHHEFIVRYADGRKEKITSTMVDTGIPGGDSSMSRTVSLPAAIATRLILEGRIPLTGVHIPVRPEIYEPVLSELEKMKITLTERKERL